MPEYPSEPGDGIAEMCCATLGFFERDMNPWRATKRMVDESLRSAAMAKGEREQDRPGRDSLARLGSGDTDDTIDDPNRAARQRLGAGRSQVISTALGEREGLQVGDMIANKYRVDGVLGIGGMAVVLAATQVDLDRLVAVKVIRAELAANPGALERLLLEAKLTARLRSEHTCRVLDVGALPQGSPYIVMEYLEGSDLGALLTQEGPLDIATAVDFILEACEAIAEAHAFNIVHRDLKPENLFVTKLPDGSPTIKVLDFGISKQLGGRTTGRALTNPSAALGSPHHMAPEQMQTPRDADARSDVWAIGTILFELLTGRSAFEGETLPAVCIAVMTATPQRASELRSDVPERLSRVIARCLNKAPADRYSSIADLAAELAPFGSFKAPAALQRIERVLAGNREHGRDFGGEPAALLREGASTPSALQEQPGMRLRLEDRTPHTATAAIRAPAPQRSSWMMVGLVGLSIVAVLVTARLVRDRQARSEPSVLISAAVENSPASKPAPEVATETLPPQSGQLEPAAFPISSASATPIEAPTSKVAPSTPLAIKPAAPARPASPQPAPSSSRASEAASPMPSAGPSSRPPDKARAPIDAWDPRNFGPRR